MRFRVPASSRLLRKGVAARAPRAPPSPPGPPGAGLGEAVQVQGEEEILASWEQVLPFVRLSLLSRELASQLGIPLVESGADEQGRAGVLRAGVGAQVWQRMWQPMAVELERQVLAALTEQMTSMVSQLELQVSGTLLMGTEDEAGTIGASVQRKRQLAAAARESEAFALKEALRVLANMQTE